MARIQRTSSISTAIERPARPTRPQAEPEYKGGFCSNPPESCSYKVFDGSKWFVEPSLCHFRCSMNSTCTVHIKFMEGSKERKKYQGTEEAVVAPVEPLKSSSTNRRKRS